MADGGLRRTATLTPSARGNRVGFGTRCTCRQPACAHLAAAGLAALDRFPALRRTAPAGRAGLPAGATLRPRRLVFELAAASPPDACTVTTLLLDEQTSRTEGAAPGTVARDETQTGRLRAPRPRC